MKMLNHREMRLYELLGIKIFRKIVFKLEHLIHWKDKRQNINYHLPHNNVDSMDKFMKYLFYNGSIHARNTIGIGIYFMVSLCCGKAFYWIDGLLLLLMIKDIYCVMLQRYNYLRIKQRKVLLEEKNQRIIRNEVGRIDVTVIKNYTQEERKRDLQLVQRMKDAMIAQTSFVLLPSDVESLTRLTQLYESRRNRKITCAGEASISTRILDEGEG